MVRTKLTFDTTNHFYSLQETLFKTIFTRARVHTAPRPCGGAYFVRDIAPGHHASAQHKSTHLRPSERPPLQQSMAAGWSIGAASSAQKNRRLLTLSDDPQMGASEPTPGSLGEGLAGGRRPFCSAGGMCCEGRGLSGAEEHLVGVGLWCPPSAPQAPTGKCKVWPARENEAKEGSRQGRAVLGMRERPLTNRKGRKSAHFQAPPIPRNPVGHLRDGVLRAP